MQMFSLIWPVVFWRLSNSRQTDTITCGYKLGEWDLSNITNRSLCVEVFQSHLAFHLVRSSSTRQWISWRTCLLSCVVCSRSESGCATVDQEAWLWQRKQDQGLQMDTSQKYAFSFMLSRTVQVNCAKYWDTESHQLFETCYLFTPYSVQRY